MSLKNQIEEYKTQRNMDKCGVAWFKFDESSGNVTDSKGTAVGTVYGATRVEGWNGQGKALNFNGSTNYVQFNNPIIPLSEHTIRFKILANPSITAEQIILENSNNNSSYLNGIQIAFPNGSNILNVSSLRGASTYYVLKSVSVVKDGNWHEVLIRSDNKLNGKAELYIDGILESSTTITLNSTETVASFNLSMGKRQGGNLYFNGQIDELEIYNDVIDLSPLNKTLIKTDTSYVYFGQNPTTLENEWVSLGESPTDEDWLNKGVDVVTQEQLERLSQQEIVGRFAVKRL